MNSFKHLITYSQQLSADLQLEEFRQLNASGFAFDNLIIGSGVVVPQALIVPYLCMDSVDLEQAWKDLNIRANGTRSHLRSLISKADVGDPMVRARARAPNHFDL